MKFAITATCILVLGITMSSCVLGTDGIQSCEKQDDCFGTLRYCGEKYCRSCLVDQHCMGSQICRNYKCIFATDVEQTVASTDSVEKDQETTMAFSEQISPEAIQPDESPASEPLSDDATAAQESEPVRETTDQESIENHAEKLQEEQHEENSSDTLQPCKSGETRPCYPEKAIGCTLQKDGKYLCKGVCKEGLSACKDGVWGACLEFVAPAQETCDNKDNNCDGVIDEGCPCSYLGKNVGVCSLAKRDQRGVCVQPVDYNPVELCDKVDNNCNGQIDESLSRPCYGGPSGTQGVGICRAGQQICNQGTWGTCQGEVHPQTQQRACSENDQDCDGLPDSSVGIAPNAVGVFCVQTATQPLLCIKHTQGPPNYLYHPLSASYCATELIFRVIWENPSHLDLRFRLASYLKGLGLSDGLKVAAEWGGSSCIVRTATSTQGCSPNQLQTTNLTFKAGKDGNRDIFDTDKGCGNMFSSNSCYMKFSITLK